MELSEPVEFVGLTATSTIEAERHLFEQRDILEDISRLIVALLLVPLQADSQPMKLKRFPELVRLLSGDYVSYRKSRSAESGQEDSEVTFDRCARRRTVKSRDRLVTFREQTSFGKRVHPSFNDGLQ